MNFLLHELSLRFKTSSDTLGIQIQEVDLLSSIADVDLFLVDIAS